ncbi:hypothetical protein Q3G72_005548 [Acer saccharum]|nr:hypothetical protein Q3G72_005548 [Acer saccharum]
MEGLDEDRVRPGRAGGADGGTRGGSHHPAGHLRRLPADDLAADAVGEDHPRRPMGEARDLLLVPGAVGDAADDRLVPRRLLLGRGLGVELVAVLRLAGPVVRHLDGRRAGRAPRLEVRRALVGVGLPAVEDGGNVLERHVGDEPRQCVDLRGVHAASFSAQPHSMTGWSTCQNRSPLRVQIHSARSPIFSRISAPFRVTEQYRGVAPSDGTNAPLPFA